MTTRRTLPTRADGRADDSQRKGKKRPPAKPVQMASIADLQGLDEDALKRIAACDALRALIQQVRRPTRHATAVTSAARSLLDFSSAKPAQKVETDNTNRLQGEITISLIEAKDGRRSET